jgi:hypothetical protein
VSAAATLPAGVRLLLPARPDPLLQRAQRLWPDSERNQREWLRAVRVVRSTSRGWLLDRPVQR